MNIQQSGPCKQSRVTLSQWDPPHNHPGQLASVSMATEWNIQVIQGGRRAHDDDDEDQADGRLTEYLTVICLSRH